MTIPPGISIAFGDPALKAAPTWTRIDNQAGISIQHFSITRGRPTERDKTGTGTASITGFDTSGILDPTNTGGTWATKIDPTKQIFISLQNPTDSTWNPLFRGFTSNFLYDVDVTEQRIGFEIECEDALGILAAAEVIPGQSGSTSINGSTVIPNPSPGDVTYFDNLVNDRIFEALADAALSVGGTVWPAALTRVFSGNVRCQEVSYAPRTPILQVIDEACDAEFPGVANRYINSQGTFTFHGRQARFDPTGGTPTSYGINFWVAGDETAFSGNTATALISSLKFTRGQDNLINAALATPMRIPDSDIEGQFEYDLSSIGTYGVRSIGFENLITACHAGSTYSIANSESETLLYADYYVQNYSQPADRVSQVTFRPQGMSGARAVSTWGLICGVELNDIITLTTFHHGGGGFSADDYFVEGISYEADTQGGQQFTNVTMTLDLSPRVYYTTQGGL